VVACLAFDEFSDVSYLMNERIEDQVKEVGHLVIEDSEQQRHNERREQTIEEYDG
jgi:hypothetical protein